jgi:hydroxyacylglutathione hydrolase
MFERFFDAGLAQTAYLIACPRTREAAVVDPPRDIDAIVTTARQHGLWIAYAIETHLHADFVSGARELAALGARVVAGPGADLKFPFHEARDREQIRLGDIPLEMLHTPGHTPEHISILVRETDQPARLLTGDTLFVGAVGRPDLLGADQARQLADQLYESLFERILSLDDDIEVHPGHGAGSLCGAGIGKEPHTTIGRERLFNPLLQQTSKAAFIAAVLDDLPDTPEYFARMKTVNRNGPPVLDLGHGVSPPTPIPGNQAMAMVDRGTIVVDLRDGDAFGAGHVPGAINIAFGPRVSYWGGWILPPDVPLLLVASTVDQAADARRQLLRVGLETVVGSVEGGFEAWRAAGGPIAQIPQISARDLRDRVMHGQEAVTIVDVRTSTEWRGGHIEQAVNIPLGDLQRRAGELRAARLVATICESGFRSSLASSLLRRAGLNVINVSDGTAALRGNSPHP